MENIVQEIRIIEPREEDRLNLKYHLDKSKHHRDKAKRLKNKAKRVKAEAKIHQDKAERHEDEARRIANNPNYNDETLAEDITNAAESIAPKRTENDGNGLAQGVRAH